MKEPFVLKLSEPASKGERTVTELTFSPPKVKHILATDAYTPGSHAADVAMVASMTGEPEMIIQEISPRDWRKVRRHLTDVWKEFLTDDPTEPAQMNQ